MIGDVPAFHAARLAKKFRAFLQGSQKSICDNINEYVHEEAMWLPSREALNDFFNEIDAIRMEVDRMEARMAFIRKEGCQ